MTNRHRCVLILALAAIAVGLGLGFAHVAQAQTVIYDSGDWIWHPGTLHYHRVYQGAYWYWSPRLGWHIHNRYSDVPYWTPGHYTYDPSGQGYVVNYP